MAAQSGPPSGYNVVVPAPSTTSDSGDFGDYVDMILDANGDPALTYIFYDPNGDGDNSESGLFFVRWNRAQGKWTTPVQVAPIGDNSVSAPGNVSSLAYDASTNTFGLLYITVSGSSGRIDYSTSTDGGQTWKAQTFATGSKYDFHGPALAIGNGKGYATFLDGGYNVRFFSGNLTAPISGWTSQVVPSLAGTARAPMSLKLDSAGVPGLAFWAYPSSGYNSILEFWRPGYTQPVQVGDSNGVQNDDVGVTLAFLGTNPRIAAFVNRDPNFDRSPLHTTFSNDGGRTWSPFAYVTPDIGQREGGRISLAVGSKGQGAIGVEHLSGNDQGQCSDPLVSRSADFQNWTTCTVSGPNPPSVSTNYPHVAFDPTDRLYYAFQNVQTGDLPAGVLLWYQPSASGSAPQISSGGIVNAASYAPTVAPGSLATIFGTNFLSGPAVGASSTPLPTTLSGVSVTVNGRPAPMVYVGATQINFQMPYETVAGNATVVVTANGVTSNSATVSVAQAAPGIFVYGNNLAVIQNQDYSVNGPGRPAKPGDYIIIYATGGGQLDNPVATGAAASTTSLSRVTTPVTVTVGTQQVTPQFAGLAPGFVGLMQVNIQVPNLPDGSYPVKITMNGVSSNAPLMSIAH